MSAAPAVNPVQTPTTVDVVIVGGGPAGLSAAVALGRSRRSVLVVDAGQPRNAPADGVHTYLGHEGTPPAELLATGRAEAAAYGVGHIDGSVFEAQKIDDDFVVSIIRNVRSSSTAEEPSRIAGGSPPIASPHTDADADPSPGLHTVKSRRLIVATGLRDELPDVPGIAERWGHEVIHCPYCHGWEVRDRVIGVLATSPAWWHHLGLFRQLSDRVVLLSNDLAQPDVDQLAVVAAMNIEVVDGKVVEVLNRNGALAGVLTADGREVPLEALAVAPHFVAHSPLLEKLGVKTLELPNGIGTYVPSEEHSGATEVAGLFIAGNVTDLMANVIGSAAQGTRVGSFVNADLVHDDIRVAVARAAASV